MVRKLSLMIMALGVLFFVSVFMVALNTSSTAVGAQEDIIPDFVGSNTCGDCHITQAGQHELHGHNFILTRVSGEAPDYPHDLELPLPEGYSWDDVTFVLGGFGWRARFIGQNGYIITGDVGSATEYYFPIIDDRTGEVIAEAAWVPYNPGEQRPYTCGACHTTGYNHNTNTTMYDMEGLRGQWEEEGVQCEECHGPGSLHVQEPIRVNMQVDGSSEFCANCHARGDVSVIEASNGFINHHEQYDEVQSSPHAALDCVDCHDPHQSVFYADADVNPTQGLRGQCTNCHLDASSPVIHDRAGVTCVDCHMAPLGANGNSNANRLWGDTSSHIFQINTDPAAPQFTEDDSAAMPYITIGYACLHCHAERTAEDLAGFAEGYHD